MGQRSDPRHRSSTLAAPPRAKQPWMTEALLAQLDDIASQRQRLALARDLVRSTAVYLIDEPTSALDKVNELEVQKLIHRTTRGKTTVLVTHNLEFLTEVDQILVLQDGQIVQQGTYRELSSREGLFKTLSKAQICE